MSGTPTERLAALHELRQLHLDAAHKLDELERALLIQTLDPLAFEHGACKLRVDGTLHRAESLKLVITRGDGTQTEHALLEAPWLLRKDFVLANQAALVRHNPRHRACFFPPRPEPSPEASPEASMESGAPPQPSSPAP